MSKTQARVRTIAQKSGVEATVVSVMSKRANVRLASEGRVLHGIRVVGGPVSVGDHVSIGWQDGIPYIAASWSDSSRSGSLGYDYDAPAAGGGSVPVPSPPPSNQILPIVPGGGGDTPPGALDPLSAAGWTIVQDTGVIYKNNVYIDPAGHIKLGTTDDDFAQISAADTTYRFWAGKLTAASAPFRVSKAGAITSTSGTIGGWTIDTSKLYNTNIHINNASQYIAIGSTVPTAYGNNIGVWIGYEGGGTNKARLSIYNDTSNYFQWDGTKLLVKAANFTLDASGNITASSATISGSITATSGAIGGWTIGATRIYSTNVYIDQAGQYISMGATPPTSYGNNVGAWLGYSSGAKMSLYSNASNYLQWDGTKLLISATNFTLDSSGNITASSASISGSITSSSGTIGGFTLASTSLSATGIKLESGSNPAVELGSATEYMTGEGIWMGKNSSGNYSMHIGDPLDNFMDYNAGTGIMHVQSMITVTQEVIATIGGRILVAPSTILTSNLSNTQTNLALNNGFETSGGGGADVFANWTENAGTGTITKDTTIYQSGLASCKLTAGSSKDTFVYQTFTVTAGQGYTYSFYTRGDGTNAGQYGIYDVTHSSWILAVGTTGVTAATWTNVSYDFTIPAGCTSIRIYYYCPSVAAAYAYFDTVILYLDYIVVRHNEMTTGDYAYICSGTTKEWVKILTTYSGTGPYTYYVHRDQAGAGLITFAQGDAVVNTGQADDGYIDIYATNSIRGATIYGPTLQGIVRPNPCTLYSQMNEHWAIGNLNGIYGYNATTYGIGLGRYKLSTYDTFITIDSTNGFRIRHKLDSDVTYTIGQWDMSGNLVLGSTTWGTNKANVKWNSSNQRLEFRGGSDGTTVASYIDTDGSFNINVGATATKPVLINWMESTSRIAYIGVYKTTVPNQCHLEFYVESISTYDNIITMNAPTNTTGKFSKILFVAQSYDYSSNQAYIDMYGGKTGAGSEPYIDINAGSPYGSILMEALVTKVTGDVRLSDGLHVGSPTNAVDPDSYSISVSGNYQSYKNSTKYTGYIFVPLTTPLTSTSWDGNDTKTVGTSSIDLSADFSAPANIYAVAIQVAASWASASSGSYLALRPHDGSTNVFKILAHDTWAQDGYCVLPVTPSLDKDIDVVVVGADATNVTVRIWGYWI